MAGRPLTTDDGRIDDGGLVAARVLMAEAGEVAAEWRELCRWDPELAPDTVPPAVEPVIAAVAGALNRPQPLGWGADEDVVEAVDTFTDRAGPAAIEELGCPRGAPGAGARGRGPPGGGRGVMARVCRAAGRAGSPSGGAACPPAGATREARVGGADARLYRRRGGAIRGAKAARGAADRDGTAVRR